MAGRHRADRLSRTWLRFPIRGGRFGLGRRGGLGNRRRCPGGRLVSFCWFDDAAFCALWDSARSLPHHMRQTGCAGSQEGRACSAKARGGAGQQPKRRGRWYTMGRARHTVGLPHSPPVPRKVINAPPKAIPGADDARTVMHSKEVLPHRGPAGFVLYRGGRGC